MEHPINYWILEIFMESWIQGVPLKKKHKAISLPEKNEWHCI